VQIAEFNPEDFTQSQQSSMDEQLLVKFYTKPREDKAATREEGRPIYHDVEYIDIRIPGDRSSGVARPATARDKARFPRHYAAFKNRTDYEGVEGTPLVEWPVITASQCAELAHFNVKTVEQLATLSDTHAQNFMGVNALKRKAQEWMSTAKDQKASTELHKELDKRDEQIAALQAQVAELAKAPKKAAPNKRKASPKKATPAKE
jgi:hypothetical protein